MQERNLCVTWREHMIMCNLCVIWREKPIRAFTYIWQFICGNSACGYSQTYQPQTCPAHIYFWAVLDQHSSISSIFEIRWASAEAILEPLQRYLWQQKIMRLWYHASSRVYLSFGGNVIAQGWRKGKKDSANENIGNSCIQRRIALSAIISHKVKIALSQRDENLFTKWLVHCYSC